MGKNNTVIFDTNIWVGSLIETDTLHKKSKEIVREFTQVEKIVPEYILLETLSVLKLISSQTEAKRCLDFFLFSHDVTILPAVHSYDKTINLFQTLNDKHLSFVDMSLLALSRDYVVKTFDKKLASAIKKYSL